MAGAHATTPDPVRQSALERLLPWALLYACALIASHIFIAASDREVPPPRNVVEIEQTDERGARPGTFQRMAYERWAPRGGRQGRPPVVMLHGSPGSRSNFGPMGRLLARAGYEVIAPDLPGFGGSTSMVPSYSMVSHAHALRLLLDELDIDHAHLVGWSQGGGVALHFTDMWPERAASVTMLASIGLQEAEGSGSYLFEHVKYGIGYVGLGIGGELIPHFGLLGTFEARHAFLRNFWDSDQRRLGPVMDRLETPTLILHGREDFLTAAWGAELHHERIQPSTLVMLEASHFIPFLQAEQGAGHLIAFMARHDGAGAAPLRHRVDLAPVRRGWYAALDRRMDTLHRDVPWWAILSLLAVLVGLTPGRAAGVVATLSAMTWVDAGIAFAALPIGLQLRSIALALAPDESPDTAGLIALHRRRARARPGRHALVVQLQPWQRDPATRATTAKGIAPALVGLTAGALAWGSVAFVCGFVGAAALRGLLGEGFVALTLTLIGAWAAAGAGVLMCTTLGRKRIRAHVSCLRRHEFWPAWVFYAPLTPWLICLAARHRGLMTFTCANPAIEAGGGMVGESKHAITTALAAGGETVLTTALLPTGPPSVRLARLHQAFAHGEVGTGYPVILKPDAGQRGFAVRLVRSDRDALEYFTHMRRTAVAQRFHAGPHEIGCMWVRDPERRDGREGRVFSVTDKVFAAVTGDGRRTLERLVYDHPRLRCQADTFIARFGEGADRVPALGERVRLVESGNHAQGTLFRDGADLITPEFEATMDRVAAGFDSGAAAWQDNGLDFGRFDIRYRSREELARGEGLGIIELNGTSSESSNLYDPSRSVVWAWGVLFRQWSVLFALGERRRAAGVRPMSPFALLRAWRAFNAGRPAVEVSD